jgi:hypothetical protein
MAAPNNILQQVITYNDAKLGYLVNLNCAIATANTKYKNFNKETANLGDTINIELPNRSVATSGLIANLVPVQQRFQPLVCDQATNSANDFTNQEFIFNAEQYMEKFGESRIQEISSVVESNVLLNATSAVPVTSGPSSTPTGQLHTESGPYRFFGDGVTPINSIQQLAQMSAIFRDYGAAEGPLDCYFDSIAAIPIINESLTQFVPRRNDELANSWDLGYLKTHKTNYFVSNQLPIHVAGTCGNNNDVLTLVSTNDPTGNNITQLTFSGVTQNVGAFNSGDLLSFDQSTGLVYLKFIGHQPSQNLVQVRVINDADATAGTVTVNIYPALQSTIGLNQNLNKALTAGATARVLPSHRAGMIIAGKAFYLAMPKLPDTSPFISHSSVDKDTGVSLRNYYGTLLGQNQTMYVTDILWASTVIPEYSMRVVFPLT